MITQEDIDAFSEFNMPRGVRENVVRALRGLNTAMHYMAETVHYDSQELDDIADEMLAIKIKLESYLESQYK